MAEILISLTIIGVIAAITLPALQANINEKTWTTQRKALYSRMSQAISLMPSLNGYGIGATQAETNSKAGLAFITDGLSKNLKITNICDKNNLQKCGIPSNFKKFRSNTKENIPTNIVGMNGLWSLQGNPHRAINTNVAAFQTANGESVALYYNPSCIGQDIKFIANDGFSKLYWPYFCASFVYDLNGLKGPNQVGKDIWYMTVLYPNDSETVMLEPTKITKWVPDSLQHDYNWLKNYCASIHARIPTLEEVIVSRFFARLGVAFGFGRDTKTNLPYSFSGSSGGVFQYAGTSAGGRCIKR